MKRCFISQGQSCDLDCAAYDEENSCCRLLTIANTMLGVLERSLAKQTYSIHFNQPSEEPITDGGIRYG